MVECMFDVRRDSGRDAATCTDPLGRARQVQLHPSDRADGAESPLNDIVAMPLVGEWTVPVAHRNRGSAHGADDSSPPRDQHKPF